MIDRLKWLLRPPLSEAYSQAYVAALMTVGVVLASVIAALALAILALAARADSPALVAVSLLAALAGALLAAVLLRLRRSTDQALTAALHAAHAIGQTAQAAAVSGDYLNTVLMSMAGSLVVLGSDNTISTVNQATLDMTGYEAHELIGKPLSTLLEGDPFHSASDTTSRRGFIRHGERVYKTKDGRKIPVSFSSAIMRDRHKRVLGIVCVAQDISALKAVEAELSDHITQLDILRQVDEELTHSLSTTRVLTLGLDMTMRLSVADAGAISLMEDDQLTPVKTIGYPTGVAEADCVNNGVVGRVLKRQQAERIVEVQADPDYAAVLSSTRAMIAIPLLSQDRLVGVLHLETARPEHFSEEVYGFLQLITARIAVATENARLLDTSRRQLDELQALYAQVSTLEQLKTDMIRIAAHDLRNPLTSIGLATRLLRKSLWDLLIDQHRQRIEDIEEAVRRMQKIISGILSLERIAKVATGEFSAVVDLQAVVRQVFETHRQEAKLKNQQYTLNLPSEPIFVKGELVELQEAASNFISNAIKYTPNTARSRSR